jgi:hypothetical protein
MVPSAFEPFLKDAPFCVMARAAVDGLFSPERLDALFERTAQTQYTRELLFSQVVELMTAVVLRQQPSVLAAWRNRVGNITVCDQAVYDKLDRMELGVSAALVNDSAARLAPVIEALKPTQKSWLKGYRVRIIDGNAPSATERRLVGLRDAWDAPLPGKALVVLDQRTGLVTDVFLTPDGHAQERSLLGEVLAVVRQRDVWIGDRNFCTLGFVFGLDRAKAGFVIRQHGTLLGTPVGPRTAAGRSPTGRVFEQRLDVTDAAGRSLSLRRVSVELDEPTQDGDTVIHVLTNLPPAAADAVAVSGLYLKRWTIEGRFLEMAQTLGAEPNTLGYPKAALFAFCLGLVASNAVAVLKAAVRAEHGEKADDELSAYYLALDIQQTYRGMMIALPPSRWTVFGQMTPDELAAALRQMARAIDLTRYRKTTRGPKQPKTRKVYKNGGHVSTHKVLLERKT